MASITANDVKIATKTQTTANWGTAASVASTELVRASALSVPPTRNNVDQEDIGAGNFRNAAAQTTEDISVSMTCDLSAGSGQGWMRNLAHFMGSDTASPAENNAGQGDYAHNLDFVSTPTACQSMAYLIEDDEAVEIPTVLWNSASIQMDVANKGSVSFGGIGYSYVAEASATNNAAAVNALSYPSTYELLTLDGANSYFRMADYDTGTALTSGNDLEITSFSVSFTRPYQPSRALRGTPTKFTKLPRQAGFVTGQLTIGLYELDSANLDLASIFQNGTYQMAEFFVDGNQLGTGDNTSFKIQIPYALLSGSFETGFSGNTDTRQPTITFDLYDPPTDAAGMTGVTLAAVDLVCNQSARMLS